MDKLISQLGIAPASVQIDLDHVMINVADAFPGKQHMNPLAKWIMVDQTLFCFNGLIHQRPGIPSGHGADPRELP